uniref:Uncharacterized protein n=1 Tax=Romanomermis culicivorax TaxID=13658 RepID=A0A915KGZ2_ROMCU
MPVLDFKLLQWFRHWHHRLPSPGRWCRSMAGDGASGGPRAEICDTGHSKPIHDTKNDWRRQCGCVVSTDR